MSSNNRSDKIQLLHKVVKKYYKLVAPPEGRPLLEQLLYACCLENARYEAADEAFHRLQESYFDWNEIRVTTVTEMSEALHNLPDPAAASTRIKKNLQSIFETRYSFDIEDMRKMNQGKAVQELEKMGGMTPFVLGYLIQNAFGGHTIPASSSIFKILVATGIVTQQEADKQQTPGLDRAIPKTKGIEFASCLHQFAADLRVQPSNKNLKAILKEAGAVEPLKRPVVAPPEKKSEKKPETKAASKKPEPTKAEAKKTAPEKPAAAKPATPKPVAQKASPEKKSEPKSAAKKPTAKKSTSPKKIMSKKTTKRKPR